MELPSATQCSKIVELLASEEPGLIKDALARIEKPQPYYHYLQTITPIFKAFLSKRGISERDIQGVRISRQGVFERTLFISVILWLYSPAIYLQGVKYAIENGIRHELEGCLLCNEHWISQQVDAISLYYHDNYDEFKEQINSLLTYIKTEVKEKKVIEEQAKPEMSNLFQ